MNTLIENVRQWGKDKGITGPNGKGTILGQLSKSQEELTETRDAAVALLTLTTDPSIDQEDSGLGIDTARSKLKDGIGDTVVTLILLADMHGWSFEECLQAAYDEIKGRTGQMVDGVFVKDSPSIDDDLGELDPSAACKLGDESCESCQ